MRAVLLPLVVLSLVACGQTDPSTAGAAIPLEGTGWTLLSYDEGGSATDVPAGVSVTARFSDGRVSGVSGCNRYTAEYTVAGETLEIGPVAGTLMACPEPAGSVETAYLAALARTATFQTTGSELALTDADGQTVLTFAEANEPTLVGATWSATGVNNGQEAVVSMVAGTEVTAEFADDGTVSGSGGCNTYTGTYTAEGEALTVGPLATTLTACSEPEGVEQQEAQFLAAMERATTYRVEGTTLELRDDEGALQVSFQAVDG